MQKIPLWVKLLIASSVCVFLGNIVGISPIKTSIYLALTFLTLTLVPIHFKKLVRYRRDFGITAGMLIALHGILAFWTYLPSSLNNLLKLPIVGGVVGMLIIVSMLITSNYVVQRKLKNAWKSIHAFIWFILPLGLMHANLAAQAYLGETPILAIAILGGLGFFGIAKLVLSKANIREGLRDAALAIAGGFFNFILLLIYT
jgi:DMSO/TMAO reductase YedYZ heme-binding membrane subunit